MLSPSSRSGVHGAIEIEDGPSFEGSTRRPKSPGSNSAILRWARGNFRIIYITLAILILLGLAVVVVAIYLVTTVKGINEKYQNESDNARNQFRRLYEQVARFRTGGHGTFRDMGALNFSLTPEQLAQAKMFGLIPDAGGQLSPGIAGLEPIKPIIGNNISHQQQQHDEPSTTHMYDRFVPDQNFLPQWANRSCDKKCSKSE
uniref:Uncharacterized protein n=1 Tax=Panagrolaimus superbus TaxID=310955 RepID=A0A914YXN5_9BILA